MNWNSLTNILPHKFYRHLSNSNKIQFWILTTGCFVTIITFWFGIALQYINVDYNRVQNERLGHIKLIDKLFPIYKVYNDSCRSLYEDEWKNISKQLDTDKESVPNEWIYNKEKILKSAKQSVDLVSRAQYYFDNSTRDKIIHNNMMICLGLKTIDLFNNELNDIQFVDSIWLFLRSNEFGFRIINSYGVSAKNINPTEALANSYVKKLVRLNSKYRNESPSKFSLRIYKNEIRPHVAQNSRIMSEELIHSSFKETMNPIVYVCFSLIVIIIVGLIIWLIIINHVFDKQKNILSKELSDEFKQLIIEEKQLTKQIHELNNKIESQKANINQESESFCNYVIEYETLNSKINKIKSEIEIINDTP